ncbi:MAG: response regulator [Syntrophorhabdaceae bacterium]|nr:response regulator [Syntrophorhabdaceae bacterium]
MDRKKCMVYVIDDDEPIRKAFGRLMRSADLDVETFSSPDEFLSVERRKENVCILLDIRMPWSTGFAFMESMAEKNIHLPVIIVSASDDVHIRERIKELGAKAFFRKPVDDQALLDAIWWAVSEIRERG